MLAARAFSLGEANADDLVFEDKALIPGWAAGSVAEAVRLGIISGYEDNTFRPAICYEGRGGKNNYRLHGALKQIFCY